MEYSTNTEYTAVSHTRHASVGSADYFKKLEAPARLPRGAVRTLRGFQPVPSPVGMVRVGHVN